MRQHASKRAKYSGSLLVHWRWNLLLALTLFILCGVLFWWDRTAGVIALVFTAIYFAVVIILYALSTLTTAILQGLGRLREPLIHNAAALVIHIIALVVMLRYLNLNIYAVLYSNAIFALVVCVLNALAIRRFIYYQQEIRKTYLVPLIASIIMAFGSYALWYVFNLVLGNSIATIVAILCGIVIYLIALVAFRGLTEPEMRRLPKGEILVRAFKKTGLLR